MVPQSSSMQMAPLFLRKSDNGLVHLHCPVAGCEKTYFTNVIALMSHVPSPRELGFGKGFFKNHADAMEKCGPFPGLCPDPTLANRSRTKTLSKFQLSEDVSGLPYKLGKLPACATRIFAKISQSIDGVTQHRKHRTWGTTNLGHETARAAATKVQHFRGFGLIKNHVDANSECV